MDADIIAGVHAVLAALKQNPASINDVWVSAQRSDRRTAAVLETARAAGLKIHEVPRAKLDRLAPGIPHQGVVARIRTTAVRPAAELSEFLAAPPPEPLLLVLDGVQDPHNLGACLRSAAAAGVHGVVIPRDRAAPLNAAARRAASGATESVPLFQVVNLARALDEIKHAGLWLVGATQDAQTDIYHTDLCLPLAWVLGGEESGLRRLTRERCDVLARIPIVGVMESLNVSVATGICLFETLRQRRVVR